MLETVIREQLSDYFFDKQSIMSKTLCEASSQKGPDVSKNIEIFVDPNRIGHDKSVKKIVFKHKYLRSYGRFANYLILIIIIIINIII